MLTAPLGVESNSDIKPLYMPDLNYVIPGMMDSNGGHIFWVIKCGENESKDSVGGYYTYVMGRILLFEILRQSKANGDRVPRGPLANHP